MQKIYFQIGYISALAHPKNITEIENISVLVYTKTMD